MPTLKDIARHADVSVCTVSRYLNKNIVVKPETAQRIEDAIKNLNYVPNVVAKSLKNNSTSNVSVILPKINNLYYSEMTSGISEELGKHQYNLFISEMDNLNKTEDEVLQTMRENLMAGVIFIGLSGDMRFKDTLQGLISAHMPVVYVNRILPYTNFPLVYPDFEKVGTLAAEHLMSRGKKRLALVRKNTGGSLVQHHVDSFCQAVTAAGLPAPVILESANTLPPDAACVKRLAKGDVDGVFVLNEMMAVGFMKELRKAGRSIPGDIAVLGFGNSLIGELTSPELSCIDLQNHALGVKSAEIIMKQILHQPFDTATVLEPSIVRREST